MTKESFETIQSIGRQAFIKKLAGKATSRNESVVKGIGDDTAVIEKDQTSYLLLSTETFMEGVDFDLTYMPLHHLGYKVISALVSDIYAMNGWPQSAMINLAVPNKISTQMVEKIYEGLNTAANDHGLQIVGGDLTASHQTLAISVSGTGVVNKGAITYREGAKPSDAVCVSGDLGGAIAGLRVLMREKQFWQEGTQQAFQPELEAYEYVVKRQLVPIARKEVIQHLSDQEIIPTSMIDISQGLASDVQNLAAASSCGFQLYQAALPIALETRRVADEMKEDVDKYALYGGEDLELLFTLSEKDADAFVKEFKDITIIGRVTNTSEGVKMQTAEGDTIQFQEIENNNQ